MTAFDRFDPFERRITDAIEEIAVAREPDYLGDILRLTARTSQRPRWAFPPEWFAVRSSGRQGLFAEGVRPRLLVLLAVLGLLAGGAIIAGWALHQQTPILRGVFKPAGSLPTPATIALLQADGQVLIFGGRATAASGSGSLGGTPESILLYDPTTGVARQIGVTTASVSYAIQLSDGRVLAIELYVPEPGAQGGSCGCTVKELINPRTGSTTTVEKRGRHLVGAGVQLQDGRVLLVGDAGGTIGVEVFDPATNAFAETGASLAPLDRPIATRLADGRVLVVGQRDQTPELYDPSTGRFTATGQMSGPREGFAATPLADGRVLIVGGWATNGAVKLGVWTPSEPARLSTTAEIYDPQTSTFSQVGPMVTPRVYHFAVALADGRVLIGGGSNSPQADVGSGGVVDPLTLEAEIFDPSTGTFTGTGSLGVARLGAGAVRLLDGRVLVLGSVHPDIGVADSLAASSIEIFE